MERDGIATTQISLVREHTETMRPSRALWVPFELGRPLGEPGDKAFQHRVLDAALALLAAPSGPVLADFEAAAPSAMDAPGWRPAIDLGGGRAGDLRSALRAEITQIEPLYRAAAAARGRTTVGLTGLDGVGIAGLICDVIDGAIGDRPRPELRLTDVVRYAADELKSIYLEVAAAAPGRPSSRQLADWFWGETVAARAVIALRTACMASDDRRLNFVGQFFLVPHTQAHRLDQVR